MSDTGTTGTTGTTTTDAGPGGGGNDDNELLATALGEAGKKALADERSARRAAEKAARDHQRELAALRVEHDQLKAGSQSDAEKAIEAARKEAAEAARKEASSATNRKLVSAEVRIAAATKLADPNDAIRLLDLDEFEVGDDGEIDTKKITKAIDDLLKDKSYLAAGATRPAGSADGGARGKGVAGPDMNAWLRGQRARP